jgi:stage V sporulation protein AE
MIGIALLKAFLLGGLICMIAQLCMDVTPFQVTPGHVLVGMVVSGAALSFLGIYQPLVDWGGAGASAPLSGFGHMMAQGAMDGAREDGLVGALKGGLTAGAAGISMAVLMGLCVAVFFRPKG